MRLVEDDIMYNFDQTYLAKINGIWTGVKGQIISDISGFRILFCKCNGFTYCLWESYKRLNDDISEEEIRTYAIKYNTSELNHRIEAERQEKRGAANPINPLYLYYQNNLRV